MISKKIPVRDLLGTLAYLIIGREFQLVAMSADIRDALPTLPNGPELVQALAELLGFDTSLRPEVPSPFRHWSLSAPKNLDNAAHWETHAEMLLRAHRVGPDSHSYVVIRHLDQPCDHVHPVFCRIAHDGSLLRDSLRDCGISQKACRDIEEQYGMPKLISSVEEKKPHVRKPKMAPTITRADGEMRKRGVLTKKQQAVQALEAVWPEDGQVITYAGFVAQLNEVGIDVLLNMRGKSVGVTYRIDGHPWKSSTLGDRYQWRGIEPHILQAVDGNDAELAMRKLPSEKPFSIALEKPLVTPETRTKPRVSRPKVNPPTNVLALLEEAYEQRQQTVYQRENHRNQRERFSPIGPKDRGTPSPGRRHRFGWNPRRH